MTEYLTKDLLLTPIERRYHEFDAPYNGSMKRVRIRSMTEREKSQWDLSGLDSKGKIRPEASVLMRCSLVALTVVGENNEPLLTVKDAEQLANQDSALTGAIYDEAVEFCGIREAQKRRTEKNSEPGETTETSGD